MVPMHRIVVVGASLAGVRAAEALRHEGFVGEIVLVGEEVHFPPYDRPPLSKEILKGAWEDERARLKVADDVKADLQLGRRAVRLDATAHSVVLDDGSVLEYDGLVIATGASPRHLPSVDASVPGVHVLRTFDESIALRAALDASPKVAIIGAGWIGCEVAATCRERGLDVTVLEFFPQPLERTLGREMGAWAAGVHRAHGVDLRCGVAVTGITGEGRVDRVELSDGSSVDADLVVVAIGVAPETAWLEGNDFDLDNGVRCDATLAVVGAEHVVAAGDVCRWPNELFGRMMRVEHWSNAVEQASVAAHTLLFPDDAQPYAAVPYVWSDQYDAKIQYVGAPGEFSAILEGDTASSKFVAGYEAEGVLVGALCVNNPGRMVRYKRFLAQRPAVADVAANLP